MAAIAAHVWLVRAPQPPRRDAPPIEVAEVLPTAAPTVSRDAQVTDVIAIPVAPIGTTGQHSAPALRPAVARSIASSRDIGRPIRVATGRFTETIRKREPEPTPARPRSADAPEAERPGVHGVQVTDLQLRSDQPLILAMLRSSVPPVAAPRPVAQSSTSEPPRDMPDQTQIIRDVLDHYTRSFETMDPRATKAVYPSVDDRALQKAYRALDGQQVRLSSCGVSIDGPDANARCRGTATYHPKVGPRAVQLTDVEWMFNLARSDAGWQIVNANARIR